MPKQGTGTYRPNEKYRSSVVRAHAMMLHELATHGEADAQSIAKRGPDGGGWVIDGKRVELPVDARMARNDPRGKLLWNEVCELAARIATGGKIRLLCHCRDAREQRTGGKQCHCEPTALQIENEATRQRATANATAC